MTKETKTKKEKFLKNLEKCIGIISETCKKTGIARKTYYKWKEEDADFKERAEDIIEGQIDYVESKLLENISKNDTTAIIFYLKTKGKDRGYTDKIEASIFIEQPLFSDNLLGDK